MREYFQKKVTQYILGHQLLRAEDNILVAVSGGADSMALLHFLFHNHYRVVAAHCNFQLREKDSEKDQSVVESYCKSIGVSCHVRSFETTQYAKNNGLSIQVAARQLRYAWFDELCEQFNFTKIGVAHHVNDTIETVFVNLLRGTGIDGICGIPKQVNRVVRPFLGVTHTDIRTYVKKWNIPFREDESNFSDYYLRNFLRLEVIPLISKRSLHFFDIMTANIEHFGSVRAFADQQATALFPEIIKQEGEKMIIRTEKLKQFGEGVGYFLQKILSNYGFNSSQVTQISRLIYAQGGKFVQSVSHTLVTERDRLIIYPSIQEEVKEILISAGEKVLTYGKWTIEIERLGDYVISKSPLTATLDWSKLTFPLVLRKWKSGDKFMPFGLKGSKKVSDFLTDLKVNAFEKRQVYVLVSEGIICWLVGYRVDQRFGVTQETSEVLFLRVKNREDVRF